MENLPKKMLSFSEISLEVYGRIFLQNNFLKEKLHQILFKSASFEDKELWDRFLIKSKLKIYPKRCSHSAKYRSKFMAGSFSKITFSKNSYNRFCLKVLASKEKDLWERFQIKRKLKIKVKRCSYSAKYHS